MAPRAYGTRRTSHKDANFIAYLAETGLVGQSARRAGYSRSRVYAWRDADPVFAEQWADAIEEHAEALEAEADRRAKEGVEQPVFYRGEIVGHVTKFSDTLLIYRMQSLRRQRPPDPANPHEVVLPGGGAVSLDEETLARIRREVYGLPGDEDEE